jgi:FkbM family methyltransferase
MLFPLWRLRTARRKLFEYVGCELYSKPAIPNIHNKLNKYFSMPGLFVEAGAVDGVFESNTYYLERFRGWRGILIEPIPDMFIRLAINRPLAYRFNCALVPFDFHDATISIFSEHAMSHVANDSQSALASDDNPRKAPIKVPARTLSSILEETSMQSIDLLSLDVEGSELSALQGIDFSKHKPKHILIECLTSHKKGEIDCFLSNYYHYVESFTSRDYFYIAK